MRSHMPIRHVSSIPHVDACYFIVTLVSLLLCRVEGAFGPLSPAHILPWLGCNIPHILCLLTRIAVFGALFFPGFASRRCYHTCWHQNPFFSNCLSQLPEWILFPLTSTSPAPINVGFSSRSFQPDSRFRARRPLSFQHLCHK